MALHHDQSSKEFSKHWLTSDSGNVATMAAMIFPVCMAAMAFGVDEGALYFERRELQAATDVAAIVAASNIHSAENAARIAFADNGVSLEAVGKKGDGIESGEFGTEARISVMTGSYLADKSTPRADRFRNNAVQQNAVKVTARRRGTLYFAASFRAPPVMSTSAIARSSAQASFSIGSRLASLNGGVINGVLGGLTGSSLSLSVMDYKSLVDADVDVLKVLDGIASDLDLEAGTYGDVLKSDVQIGQFALVLASVTSDRNAAQVLRAFEKDTRSSGVTVPLSSLISLGTLASHQIGHGSDMIDSPVSVFDMLTGAVAVADGKHQVKLNLGASLPGLASTYVDLSIGEPPQGSTWLAIGDEGGVVRTAQTRLRIIVQIGGSGLLSGATIRLPIYVELASAEAKLSRVSCPSGQPSSASVDLAVKPAVFEAWIGEINGLDMEDFSSSLNPKKVAMIDAAGIKATAFSHLAVSNISAKTVSFSASDIGSGKAKSVSTEEFTQTLTHSLLEDMDLKVNLLGLGLGSAGSVRTAIATALDQAAPAVDGVISNTLNTLGVKVGQADVWVNGVQCQRSVLVQ